MLFTSVIFNTYSDIDGNSAYAGFTSFLLFILFFIIARRDLGSSKIKYKDAL